MPAIERYMSCLLTWSEIPTNRLCHLKQKRSRNKIMRQRPRQSSLYILGISAMPAIKRHMSCLLGMERDSDEPCCVTLRRTDLEMRLCVNDRASRPYTFWESAQGQLSKSMCDIFEHKVTFRRTVLCNLTQNRMGSEIMRQPTCQSPLNIFGTSWMSAIDRHMSFFSLSWPSDKSSSVSCIWDPEVR